MNNDIIALLANLALALSFIVGLVFGISQVKAASRDRRERLTLETLSNYQTREFAELMIYINSHDMPPNRKGMMALPADEQIMILQFSQQMEALGILVADKVINIDLVDKTLGSFITTSWEKYRVLFTDIREKQGDPFLGEYFEWLAKYIDERMKNKPRKPFYESHPLSGKL